MRTFRTKEGEAVTFIEVENSSHLDALAYSPMKSRVYAIFQVTGAVWSYGPVTWADWSQGSQCSSKGTWLHEIRRRATTVARRERQLEES